MNSGLMKCRIIVLFCIDQLKTKHPHSKGFPIHPDRQCHINEHCCCPNSGERREPGKGKPITTHKHDGRNKNKTSKRSDDQIKQCSVKTHRDRCKVLDLIVVSKVRYFWFRFGYMYRYIRF